MWLADSISVLMSSWTGDAVYWSQCTIQNLLVGFCDIGRRGWSPDVMCLYHMFHFFSDLMSPSTTQTVPATETAVSTTALHDTSWTNHTDSSS